MGMKPRHLKTKAPANWSLTARYSSHSGVVGTQGDCDERTENHCKKHNVIWTRDRCGTCEHERLLTLTDADALYEDVDDGFPSGAKLRQMVMGYRIVNL